MTARSLTRWPARPCRVLHRNAPGQSRFTPPTATEIMTADGGSSHA